MKKATICLLSFISFVIITVAAFVIIRNHIEHDNDDGIEEEDLTLILERNFYADYGLAVSFRVYSEGYLVERNIDFEGIERKTANGLNQTVLKDLRDRISDLDLEAINDNYEDPEHDDGYESIYIYNEITGMKKEISYESSEGLPEELIEFIQSTKQIIN